MAPPTTSARAAIARLAAGSPSDGWSSAPLDHRVENLTTASLLRRCCTLDGGACASVVVKTLQPASAHPFFTTIPEEFHAEVLEDLDWQGEPRVYGSGLAAALPAPLRMPEVYAIVAEGPDRTSLWLEDVDDTSPWDLARYRRTAEALGALAGRWTGEEASAAFGLGGRDLSRLFYGKVLNHDLPLQADDAFWDDPVVAGLVDGEHRRDLARLAEVVPALLGADAGGPTGVCHGDATPDNFREPGDGSIVALDWSYGHVGSVGTDLCQLLAGRFESGAAAGEDVAAVADTVVSGYLEGLAGVRRAVDPDRVRAAMALHLAVRSAFSALRLDQRDGLSDEDRLALLAPRARLARFAMDQALSLA